MGLLCIIGGHSPSKKDVVHDGTDFRSVCRRCGKPMVRDTVRRVWQVDNKGTPAV